MAPALALLLAALAPARADVVNLANGNAMAGIVVETTAEGVNLQVDDEGFITVDSSTIASVKKETAEQNERRRAKWREDRKKAEDAEAGKAAYAEKQRAKGLVLYEDEWMTPVEARQRMAAKDQQERYNQKHAQTFIAREGVPQPFAAPGVAPPRRRGSYNYYYFGGGGTPVVDFNKQKGGGQ
jgi:hypothetical protein